MNLVIKIGGADGIAEHQAAIVADIANLHAQGHRITVVHGGSDAATRLGEELGHPARFASSPSGHTSRLTDARTLEIFSMATAAINRSLVRALQAVGVNAIGLSGLDGRILEAERKGPFRVVENGRQRIVRGDLTGKPKRANAKLLGLLIDAGHVPVIAPLALDINSETALNVDGDRAAAQLARATASTALVILTAVPGILSRFPDETSLIPHATIGELDKLIELAGGRMKKKILAATEALDPTGDQGTAVRQVIIAPAKASSPVSSALAGHGSVLGETLNPPKPLSSVANEAAGIEHWASLERRHGPGFVATRELAFESGRGAELFSTDGRRYLDAAAAFGASSLGHNDPELTKAIGDQAARQLACTPSYTNEQRALFMQALARALPGELDRIFLCNSGTEAVEAALKFARLSKPKNPGVLAFMRGFHGRTLGAVSTTWERHFREPFAPLLPGVVHVPMGNLDKVIAALDEPRTHPIGSVLLEVIQGEGGVRCAPDHFLREISRLCKARGLMLIVDEVQTGFGRTGKLFGIEHSGIEPDLLCLGKGIAGGLAMGAVAIGPGVEGLGPGLHGSTFGGNPLACAAARVVLNRLQAGLTQRAAAVGERLLLNLASIESPLIREVRGVGLMIGIELKTPARPVIEALLEAGVITLSAGPRVLRLLPPLVLTNEQADELVLKLREVMSRLETPTGAFT